MNKKLLLNVDFFLSQHSSKSINKSNSLTKWLCLVLVLGAFNQVIGQAVFNSRANGNWNSATTWTRISGTDGDGIPDSNDNVNIISGHTINSGATPACAAIAILGTLNMANTNTLTVGGDVSGNGNWTGNTVGAVTTISLTGNWSFTGTSAGTGAITIFTGTASQALTGRISSANSGTLRINKTGGSVILGNALTVATFTNTLGIFDANTYLLTATTNTLTAGTLRVGAANWGANYSFTPTPPTNFTIDYYNATPTINASITYQNLTFSGAGTTANPSSNLTIQGNLSNVGGGVIDFNDKNVTLSGGNVQSVAGFTTTGNVAMTKTGNKATFTGAVNGSNLTINGSGGRLALGNYVHTFTGTWLMSAGTLEGNTSTLKIGGNITGTGGSFLSETGTVDLNGIGQTVRQLDFYNLIMSGTGTKTFTAATTIGNNLEIGLGINANLGTFTHKANTFTSGGAVQDLGSWGSTSSSADNKNDTYFATTSGIVNVGKTYCTFNFPNVNPITNVVFKTISNASSALTSSPKYENYINYKTNVTRGQSYPITVQGNTDGNYWNYYTVYFDWNQDGDFVDSGEVFYIGTIINSNGIDGKSASVSIPIPTNASLGTTRMRVISQYNNYNATPCSASSSYGQVEDYSVNIEAACSGTPSPGNTIASVNPVCPNVPFTLSVENPTSGGATYQWETSLNGSTWRDATPAPVTIINTNFSTIPTNATTIGNSTSITSGELILTSTGVTRYSGGYVINTTPGSNITPFTASFDYRIFDGGGADGMSLSYGPNIDSGTVGGGEKGEGSGFILQLDTYDNVTGQNTGSMIRIFYDGVQIFANSLNPFNLRNSSYRNAILAVDANGSLSLKIAGTTIVSGLSVPSYVAADKTNWKFKFSARVGDINDKHSINKIFIQCGDVLSTNPTFTTSQTEATYYRAKVACGGATGTSSPTQVTMSSVAITTQPVAPVATCIGSNGTQTISVVATGAGLAYSWRKGGVPVPNGGVISGQGSATLTLTNPIAANAGSYDVVISGGCSSVITSIPVSVTVNTPVTIGTQPADLTICEGGSGSFAVETSVPSSTYQWQYSSDGNWTNVDTAQLPYVSGYTTKTLTLTNAPVDWNGNRVRCVVTNSGCSTNSNAVLLTIKALPTPPTQGTITAATCAVPTGSVVLSGLPSGDWTIVSNPATVSTTGTGISTTISGLAPNTYTFTVKSTTSTCTSVASANVVIPGLVTNTWNGTAWSWPGGAPTIDQNVIFTGSYPAPTTPNVDINSCSCEIKPNANVVIRSGSTLSVINSLTVAPTPTASLTFKDQASLYQKNDNAINTGVITYERLTKTMKDQDYVYWSSPVVGQKFSKLSLGTYSYFAYDIATDNWLHAADNMEAGRGYIIKSRNAGPFPYNQTIVFNGTPNNGALTLAMPTMTDAYILVGNPYPSALSADDFLLANKDILDGTLYFWSRITALNYDGTKWKYASNDYATYNLTGGVVGSPAGGKASGSGSEKPSGNIGAGQSFFVNAKTGGANVKFKNSMRVAGKNTQFFRSSKTNKTTALEKNRVWLNLTNKTGAFKQMLVGYIEGATNDYESIYDGLTYNANAFVNFYSIDKGQEFAIQGRALPFKETDLVPLGYSSTIADSFTIGIDNVDGSFTSQGIYLEDKVAGIIHNLRETDYTFTTAKGTFNDRFVLRYTNKTLGTGEFELAENAVLVAVANKEIKINAFSQTIDKVFIYDVSGKLIYKKEKVGNPTLTIENLKSANQVLVVKVVLDNKHIETKKVIF